MMFIIFHIIYHSYKQYVYFIKRRIKYHEETFEDGKMPPIEKLAVGWIALILILFVLIFIIILYNAIILAIIAVDGVPDNG